MTEFCRELRSTVEYDHLIKMGLPITSIFNENSYYAHVQSTEQHPSSPYGHTVQAGQIDVGGGTSGFQIHVYRGSTAVEIYNIGTV